MALPISNKRTKNISWWKQDTNEAHKGIFDLVNRLHGEQTPRMERNIRCLQLYGNADLSGVTPYSYAKAAPVLPDNRVKLNIVSSMVDTVCAKISKMKPKVTFLTSGGDWSIQRQAKQLDKFILGAFYENGVHQLHQSMFKDGAVMDMGALKHYADKSEGRICSERVLPTELYVDPADSMHGKPTHMYQAKIIHKDVACELYPKHQADILASAGYLGQQGFASEEMLDFVVIIEAWRLPIGKGKGRHVICIEKTTLLDEEYKRNYFPFTFSRWSTPSIGFWGQSLADRLTGNQIEINKMLRIIQRSFHLGSAFKVFLERGSRVVKEHINNEIGSIVYYTGTAPQFYVPKTVHEEFFRHLEWLVRSSYEEAGVSQMSASSRKPAGLDSGRALRDYNDIESERFAIVSQDYEATFLETARQYIDLAKELAEDDIDLEVVAESKRFIETIKWSEVALDKNQYIMQMFPTSMLPHQPAGRLAFIQELIQGGFVDPEMGAKLLDMPDIESWMNNKTAPIDDLLYTLEMILYKGKMMQPEPFQDLARGVQMFQSAYLRAKNEGAPEKRLGMLRNWIASANAMMAKAAQAQQVQMAAAQPQLPAQPAPLPDQAAVPAA